MVTSPVLESALVGRPNKYLADRTSDAMILILESQSLRGRITKEGEYDDAAEYSSLGGSRRVVDRSGGSGLGAAR